MSNHIDRLLCHLTGIGSGAAVCGDVPDDIKGRLVETAKEEYRKKQRKAAGAPSTASAASAPKAHRQMTLEESTALGYDAEVRMLHPPCPFNRTHCPSVPPSQPNESNHHITFTGRRGDRSVLLQLGHSLQPVQHQGLPRHG
jgi:hypothetical protein